MRTKAAIWLAKHRKQLIALAIAIAALAIFYFAFLR